MGYRCGGFIAIYHNYGFFHACSFVTGLPLLSKLSKLLQKFLGQNQYQSLESYAALRKTCEILYPYKFIPVDFQELVMNDLIPRACCHISDKNGRNEKQEQRRSCF
jgi:hypothetical protein